MVETRVPVARVRAGQRAAAAAPQVAAPHVVRRLYVIRESSAYAWLMFAAMMQQVLERHAALPNVALVLAHGVDLVRPGPEGERLRRQFEVREIRAPRGAGKGPRRRVVAYLFIIDGDGFLLSQMSAARPELDGANAFGLLLAGLISELRPAELHTGPAGRFGRSTQVFSRVGDAVRLAGCRVFTDEAPEGLDLTSSNDALRWDMYGLIAAAEVREILKRLTIGRLLDARAGRWPLGARQIVLGYEVDGEGRPRISSDPAVRGWVRSLIDLAADERLTLEQITESLAAQGLVTHKLADYYPDAADAADELGGLARAARPTEVVRRLLGHLETYLTGNYRFELTCPVMGVSEWASVAVHREEGDQYGVFRVPVPVGLPDGGWAPEETIRRAITLRCQAPRRRRTGGAAHADVHKPLSGLALWVHENQEFTLSAKTGAYRVLARDAEHQGLGWHDGAGTGRQVATISPGALHRAIAERITATLADEGVDATEVRLGPAPARQPQPRPEQEQHRVTKWTEELERLETMKEGLIASIALARGKDEGALVGTYEKTLKTTLDEISTLKAQLEAATSPPVEVVEVTEVEVGSLPEVIKLLALGKSRYSPALADRVQQIFRDLRFEIGAHRIDWSMRLLLGTDQGVVSVPVRGSVPNASRARGPLKATVKQQKLASLRRMWVTEGMSVPAIAARIGLTTDAVERRIRKELVQSWGVSPSLRGAVVACPVPAVRQVLDRHAAGEAVEDRWERLVVDTYAAATHWKRGWNADALGDRQKVLDLLAGADDPQAGLPVAEVEQRCGVDRARIVTAMASEPTDRGGRLRAPLYGRVLDKDHWTKATPEHERRVRIRTCPWCATRTVTAVCRAPEMGHSPVLCTTCRRRPDDPNGVRFPVEYVAGAWR